MSIHWPVTQVRKSNCGEGLGTRATGRPEPVTASSTLLLPDGKKRENKFLWVAPCIHSANSKCLTETDNSNKFKHYIKNIGNKRKA